MTIRIILSEIERDVIKELIAQLEAENKTLHKQVQKFKTPSYKTKGESNG